MSRKKTHKNNLPSSVRPQSSQIKVAEVRVEQTTIRHGPLPSPEDLNQYNYNQIVPGSAERIVGMAEKQSAHRRDLEQKQHARAEKAMLLEFRDRRRGHYLAAGVVIIVLGAVTYLAISGHDLASALLGIGGLGSLASVFIWGRNNKDTRGKDDIVPHK